MTLTTHTLKMKTPGFRYAGFDVPGLNISTSLINDLGTSEPAYKLASKSIPLAWKVALYMVGRDLAFGIEDAESLPEPVMEAGRLVYSECHRKKGEGGIPVGVWHKDAVLFLPRSEKPKGMWPMPNGYALAKYFKDIMCLKENGDIEPSPDTIEEYVWLPPGNGGFIIPPESGEGTYHQVTGTPRQTIRNKKKVIKRLVEAGLTGEQAKNELSRFYRADSGVHAVYSSCNEDSDGPLCVNLYCAPSVRDLSKGSFAARRSAEQK